MRRGAVLALAGLLLCLARVQTEPEKVVGAEGIRAAGASWGRRRYAGLPSFGNLKGFVIEGEVIHRQRFQAGVSVPNEGGGANAIRHARAICSPKSRVRSAQTQNFR